MNGNGCLIVIGRREYLTLFGRDRRVLLNQRAGNTPQCFNAQGQRSDIQQQDVVDIARQHCRLNRSAHGNRFVRINVLACFLAEKVCNLLLDHRHPCLTTYQDDIVDTGSIQTGVFQSGFHRP